MYQKISLLISFISLFFSMTAIASDKILIITHVHSRPDFIELHAKTFKAFLKEDYEYVVFNDAPNDTMREQMERMCKKLGIRCFRVPQEMHNGRQTPNYRHCDGIKYSLESLGFKHDGIVLMIDSDMFLIKPFSAAEYMKEYDFIGGFQSRSNDSIKVVHSAPCLVFMDMRKLPNKRTLSFETGYIEGLACDVGGSTYYYFKNNPNVKTKLFTAISTHLVPREENQLRELGYDEATINFIFILGKAYGMEFHGDNNFLHYYAGGSNWPGYSSEYHQEKTRLLNHYIDQLVITYKK